MNETNIEMNFEHGKWDLTALHAEFMMMLGEIDRICTKYGLRYYSSGGTTIGALRHQGFIPWDDDMDIEMPRADFVKFLDVAKTELPSYFQIRRGGADGMIWGSKLVDSREEIRVELEKKTGLRIPGSPFVDIFYIDGVPSDIRGFRRWNRRRKVWRLCQLYRYPETATLTPGRHSFRCYIGRALGFFISPFFPRTKNDEEMMKLQDQIALEWPFDDCNSVVEPAFFHYRTKRIVPRNWYGNARVVKFEKSTIRIPERAEDRCFIDHEDFMSLPPVKWRIPEHAMHRAYNHV